MLVERNEVPTVHVAYRLESMINMRMTFLTKSQRGHGFPKFSLSIICIKVMQLALWKVGQGAFSPTVALSQSGYELGWKFCGISNLQLP